MFVKTTEDQVKPDGYVVRQVSHRGIKLRMKPLYSNKADAMSAVRDICKNNAQCATVDLIKRKAGVETVIETFNAAAGRKLATA